MPAGGRAPEYFGSLPLCSRDTGDAGRTDAVIRDAVRTAACTSWTGGDQSAGGLPHWQATGGSAFSGINGTGGFGGKTKWHDPGSLPIRRTERSQNPSSISKCRSYGKHPDGSCRGQRRNGSDRGSPGAGNRNSVRLFACHGCQGGGRRHFCDKDPRNIHI